MSLPPAVDGAAAGAAALRAGEWDRARAAFEAELRRGASAEALVGLSRTLWWLGDLEGALAVRERAHAAFRRDGRLPDAVRTALWLAREYRAGWGNDAASNGWFTRAQRLVERLEAGPEHGWLDLARAERSTDPAIQMRYARAALETAERLADPELEIHALARLGLARVALGQLDEGTAQLDEAMAAAVAAEEPEAVGDTACVLMLAAELVGSLERFAQWGQVVDSYVSRHGHAPLLAFCGSCVGELSATGGRWEEAEKQLEGSIRALEATGHRSRCVHPATRLADLRVRQGRLEEADAVLRPYAGLPEAVAPAARLALARGEHGAAAVVLERRLAQLGERNLAAVPLLSLLVEARLGTGDASGARNAADRLDEVAALSGLERVAGLAALARGRVAAAEGDGEGAVRELERAVRSFEGASMPMESAVARHELARAVAPTRPDVAIGEARAALRAFEKLGASRSADEAAAFLRSLGVRGQTGPKGLGVLTRREREILDLLATGLTNAEIAGRLFISPKTAGNHVSNVLVKLGVRTRTEAAAYALRNAPGRRSTT